MGQQNARITAVQICAHLQQPNSLPLILQLIENQSNIPLSISAVGALGQLGTASEIPILEQILAGDRERLKPAAKAALKRITERTRDQRT
jgi:HEAT repeat protein